MSTEGGHRSKFSVSKRLLRKIRNGQLSTADYQYLLRVCRRWVRRFSGGLSIQDQEDVALGAITNTIPAMQAPENDAAAVGEMLRRELQRLRARSKYEAFRMDELEENQHARSTGNSAEDEHIATEDVLAMAYLCRRLFPRALERLSDREHDLLVEEYDLDSIGFARRHPTLPSFPTDGARRTALSRARLSFSEQFEAEIEAARSTLGQDPHVVEQTLRFVRGENRSDLLIHLSDLEDAVKLLRPTDRCAN